MSFIPSLYISAFLTIKVASATKSRYTFGLWARKLIELHGRVWGEDWGGVVTF